jgi:hypothetical protein
VYGQASFIGPVAGAGAVAIIVVVAGTATFVVFRLRKRREMEKLKQQMSDSSRRQRLSQGVVYGSSNPLVASKGAADGKGGPLMINDGAMGMARQASMSKGTYIGRAGSSQAVQVAAFSPQQASRGAAAAGALRRSASGYSPSGSDSWRKSAAK